MALNKFKRGGRTHHGFFRPIHPEKYLKDPTNIIYRSSWELTVMRTLDGSKDVLRWASEEIAIGYRDPVKGYNRRYFPDFYVEKKTPEGKIEKLIIEVKPKKETKAPPTIPGSISKKHLKAVHTWLINSAKWEAAKLYCEHRNIKFVILTEENLPLAKK
jgi:hypothetical protein